MLCNKDILNDCYFDMMLVKKKKKMEIKLKTII